MLAASACLGQFSSSTPESYSSSVDTFTGALEVKCEPQFSFHITWLGCAELGCAALKVSDLGRGHEKVAIYGGGEESNEMCSDLTYLGSDFPWTTSLVDSTAMMSE